MITGIKGQNVKNVAGPFRNGNDNEIKIVYNMALKQLCLVLESNRTHKDKKLTNSMIRAQDTTRYEPSGGLLV